MDGAFSKAVERFAAKAGKALEGICRKRMSGLFAEIILSTPAASGRARGAWLCGINSMPGGEGGKDRQGDATVARMARELEAWGIGKGKTIWLVNHAPYILHLEYGDSDKQPEGMVRRAIAAFRVEG